MARRRNPYAMRSVYYVVAALSAILVIGLAIGGYEINHLRTQVSGLQLQLNTLSHTVTTIYHALLTLAAQVNK